MGCRPDAAGESSNVNESIGMRSIVESDVHTSASWALLLGYQVDFGCMGSTAVLVCEAIVTAVVLV